MLQLFLNTIPIGSLHIKFMALGIVLQRLSVLSERVRLGGKWPRMICRRWMTMIWKRRQAEFILLTHPIDVKVGVRMNLRKRNVLGMMYAKLRMSGITIARESGIQTAGSMIAKCSIISVINIGNATIPEYSDNRVLSSHNLMNAV